METFLSYLKELSPFEGVGDLFPEERSCMACVWTWPPCLWWWLGASEGWRVNRGVEMAGRKREKTERETEGWRGKEKRRKGGEGKKNRVAAGSLWRRKIWRKIWSLVQRKIGGFWCFGRDLRLSAFGSILRYAFVILHRFAHYCIPFLAFLCEYLKIYDWKKKKGDFETPSIQSTVLLCAWKKGEVKALWATWGSFRTAVSWGCGLELEPSVTDLVVH